MAEHYDAIVVGSGQGGGPLASAFATAGQRTAIIEREHLGGTCVNEGCTPTKTMVASGRVAYLARRGADYGVKTGDISVDMEVVRKRKRDIVDMFRGGSERGTESTEGLDLLMGEARFVDARTLHVAMNDGSTRELTSDTIVINVGERPAPVSIPGAEDVEVLTSTTVMELDTVPEHLIVLGGGIIGLEFGQLFRRLGADVTIVHRGEHLLSREDPDVADEVRKILEDDGITVLLGANVSRIMASDGGVALHIGDDGREVDIAGSHLLGAIGRVPNTDALRVDRAGIEVDKRGYILTDDAFRTNVDGILAIGDVRPGPKFTHVSYDDYRVLKANLIDGDSRTITDRLVPSTMFTDPQLGRIGLSETAAKEGDRPVRIARMPMSSVARALETDETRGMMKVIVDAETERILGAAILGIEGGEIMTMIQIAMMGDLPFTALRDGIFAHPGLGESLNNLLFAFDA